jgi:hypothetical protein
MACGGLTAVALAMFVFLTTFSSAHPAHGGAPAAGAAQAVENCNLVLSQMSFAVTAFQERSARVPDDLRTAVTRAREEVAKADKRNAEAHRKFAIEPSLFHGQILGEAIRALEAVEADLSEAERKLQESEKANGVPLYRESARHTLQRLLRLRGCPCPSEDVLRGLKAAVGNSADFDELQRKCKKPAPTSPTKPTNPTGPTSPTSPPSPPTTPTGSVRVQVDMYRMVFNNGSVQGAGTVTSDPTGISCSISRDYTATAPAISGTCAASFVGGTHLTLTATADPQSSVFHGWSNASGQQATAGDPCYVQGTGPCELTLGSSGGYEIGASFGLQTRVLTINNPDQTHGEVLASAPTGGQQAICGVEDEKCSVIYPYGQPVIVDANGQNPPITGYGLQGCDAPYPGTKPCQVTMTTAKTLAVNWVDQGG